MSLKVKSNNSPFRCYSNIDFSIETKEQANLCLMQLSRCGVPINSTNVCYLERKSESQVDLWYSIMHLGYVLQYAPESTLEEYICYLMDLMARDLGESFNDIKYIWFPCSVPTFPLAMGLLATTNSAPETKNLLKWVYSRVKIQGATETGIASSLSNFAFNMKGDFSYQERAERFKKLVLSNSSSAQSAADAINKSNWGYQDWTVKSETYSGYILESKNSYGILKVSL